MRQEARGRPSELGSETNWEMVPFTQKEKDAAARAALCSRRLRFHGEAGGTALDTKVHGQAWGTV